jgi:hypothetical protein
VTGSDYVCMSRLSRRRVGSAERAAACLMPQLRLYGWDERICHCSRPSHLALKPSLSLSLSSSSWLDHGILIEFQ